MAELKQYVSVLDPKQEKLFIDRFNQYRWEKIRQKLGLGDLKFHDLRKTFGSVLAQNGISTVVTQKLLEHLQTTFPIPLAPTRYLRVSMQEETLKCQDGLGIMLQ